MHIVQLGPIPPPEGGVSRNMLAIQDELLKRNHKCTLIATTSGQSTNEKHVFRPRSPLSLIKLLRTIKSDVVHLHLGGEITGRVLSLALAVSVVASGKCVLTVHSGAFPLSQRARNAKRNSVAGAIFRRFSYVIAVNDSIAEVFGRYGVEESVIKVILPFSLQRPDMSVKLRPDLETLSSTRYPLLLSVGGLEADYDPLFQIAAMPRVLEKYPTAILLIVGGGSLQSEIESEIKRAGLQENVILAGDVPHNETLHLIDRADVLLRTTLFDGDAISVREALFLGTPVLATDNAMRPEGVLLIDGQDQTAFLQQIDVALKTRKRRLKTQSKANQNIESVIDLYSKLVRR